MKRIALFLFLVAAGGVSALAETYSAPPAPVLRIESVTNGARRVSLTPYPAVDAYRVFTTDDLGHPWTEDFSGTLSNFVWAAPHSGSNFFVNLRADTLSSNALLSATLLNRISYGQTPDLLDRLAVVSPQTYLNEQLNPETITERAGLAHTNIPFLQARFGTATNIINGALTATSGPGSADISDMQAWLVLNAVYADRQLLEILTQFFENHFITQAGKSANMFVGFGYRDRFPNRAAAEWEWREVSQRRNLLLNTNATFHDFLKVSVESPAMIVYLDTATSRGNPPNLPNENYSRELLELFAMGVDNGYDQSDITNMAPCWTGWTVELVNVTNALNVFAPRSTIKLDPAGNTAFTNLIGVWSFNYKQNNHAGGAKIIFGGKTVPARFGPPYTTKLYGGNVTPGLYQLSILARTGTNGLADGYDVARHLANLPFTQEFLSVKLCRLFVHDDFHTGYDFTSAGLSEEGQLVKACMAAWEASNGNLRAVLGAIFNSALFRSHGGNAHKVKTPLEFCASAVRALRQSTNGTGLHGTWTATTDGYGISFSPGPVQSAGNSSALMRIGGFSLFNREEPDGYPEGAGSWVNAGALGERIRFVSSLCKAVGTTVKNDDNTALNNNVTDPVRLLQLRLPNTTNQKDATKVSELFLGLFFPGEGRGNLTGYRDVAVNYLNTADDGVTVSLFSALTVSNAANSTYDNRVRGLVTMLLSLQRFEEQ